MTGGFQAISKGERLLDLLWAWRVARQAPGELRSWLADSALFLRASWTFATSLPEEYQLLADALAEAGLAGPEVDAWLEAARQCGLATKFTVPRSGGNLKQPVCTDMVAPPL